MRAACAIAMVAHSVVVCGLAACGSDNIALPIEPQCNPLGINHCMTPWPNAVFEVDDATTPTGRHIAIPPTTLPSNASGMQVDPTEWNWADGFSPAAPMIMSFPGGVSTAGLPPPDDMDLSLAADSPTVILDMTTGERVAHFAEVDAQAGSGDEQALFIRPAARLTGGHRYAVAITNKVTAPDGSPLAIPPGFAALRDGQHTDHALLEAERPRFAEVLSALGSAGFDADDLVVAWEFTVASDDFIHSDMIAARDAAVTALASHTIAYTIGSDAIGSAGDPIRRVVSGMFDAPLFLTENGEAQADPVIARGSDGLPALQGFYQAPFVAVVPACAYGSATRVGMVIYGHGLLGTSEETQDGDQRDTAAALCMVFVGTDMRGMSTQDIGAVALALNDVTHADAVMEVLEQGIVNHVALHKALETTFATSLFVGSDGTTSLVDPGNVVYYGLSQGGIFGTSVVAYDDDLTQAVLGVGAANYSLLLDRSADWTTYGSILAGAYPNRLDQELLVALMQMRWDKTEPSGVVNSVLAGAPTSSMPKQLLMQIAIGDDQVSNYASYWWARSTGVSVVGPTPYTPWGLTVAPSPLPLGVSGLVIMEGAAPQPPLTNTPAPTLSPDLHDLTRTQPATWRQMGDFYTTHTIVNECSGSGGCVCEAGACN